MSSITRPWIPHDLQFETGTKCNANCKVCVHSKMARKGSATWTTMINVMYDMAHIVSHCSPFLMQEPLLEPRLSAILANLKMFNPNITTSIYSNMSIYPKETWKEIIKWGTLDTLCVSFYGYNRKMYRMMQPPLDWARTRRNIKKLIRLRDRLGYRKPEVHMMYLITKDTWKQANKFRSEWMNIVDLAGFIKYDAWCGELPYDDKFETNIWGPSEEERLPCRRLWSTMTVHYDGTLVPCCLDYQDAEPCGNVNGHPSLFWESKRLNEIRDIHSKRRFDEIPICKDCSVWRRDIPESWKKMWLKEKVISGKIAPSAR